MKVRKKPVIVNAWKLPEFDKFDDLALSYPIYIAKSDVHKTFGESMRYIVLTFEGRMSGMPGDYLVQGNHDDVWVVKKEIFEDTYEVVEE